MGHLQEFWIESERVDVLGLNGIQSYPSFQREEKHSLGIDPVAWEETGERRRWVLEGSECSAERTKQGPVAT